MGSRFLKKTEAAKVLGCSVRTIFAKIERGELRPVSQGHYVGVWEEDVIELRNSKMKRDETRTLPFAVNRQTLHRHDTEIRLLRQDLDQVMRVLNIRRERLKVSDLEARALYLTAQEYVEKGWPPQVEELWASHFLRMDVDFLFQIEKITKDHHPWRHFLRLVKTMALQPYNTELALQLSSGRDSVQNMVSVWFEIKQISPRQLDAMMRREASPSKRLLGVLDRRQKKFNTP